MAGNRASRHVCHATAIALVGLPLLACGDKPVPRPSRADCIVMMTIDWPSSSSEVEREALIDTISMEIVMAPVTLGDDFKSTLATPRRQRDRLYMQFFSNCSERVEMAEALVAHVRRVVPDSPDLRVSRQRISPGLDTIEAWGPEWSDGPSPSGT
jgi:hypothetical protein